jgi:hypothetical protein
LQPPDDYQTEMLVPSHWPSTVHEEIFGYLLRLLERHDPIGISGTDSDMLGVEYWDAAEEAVPRLFRQAKRDEDVGRILWKCVTEVFGQDAGGTRDDRVWAVMGQLVWDEFGGAFLSCGKSWFHGFSGQRGETTAVPTT